MENLLLALTYLVYGIIGIGVVGLIGSAIMYLKVNRDFKNNKDTFFKDDFFKEMETEFDNFHKTSLNKDFYKTDKSDKSDK